MSELGMSLGSVLHREQEVRVECTICEVPMRVGVGKIAQRRQAFVDVQEQGDVPATVAVAKKSTCRLKHKPSFSSDYSDLQSIY